MVLMNEVVKVLPVLALMLGTSACTPRARVEQKETPMTDAQELGSSLTEAAPSNAITIAPREGPTSHLVVLLHGVGADAASFQSVARALARGLPRAELVVPDGFHPFDGGATGRQWFSLRGITETNRPGRVREAGAEVSRWIDGELDRRKLGRDRLVVVGFSQGAIVAAWLAMHRAPGPAAVVMLSGRVAEDEVAAKAVTSTPVLVLHGAEDRVIPVSVVDPGTKVLDAWGARVEKRVYPDLGHEVDARELRDIDDFLRRALGPT